MEIVLIIIIIYKHIIMICIPDFGGEDWKKHESM